MISPGDFIPVAERTGQIIELGEWVLSEVARHCTYWDTLGLDHFRVCVNISPLQFNQPELTRKIRDFLDRSGLNPARIELELTESAIMTDARANIEKLKELAALGLDLAVDDFGTGYSSLSYLKRFPITTLKIDQSFVADMSSADGVAIVDAIIVLARTLNLRSIAEGIETQEQLRHLVQNNCDLLQGYYFARPLYPEDVPDALRRDYARDITEALMELT